MIHVEIEAVVTRAVDADELEDVHHRVEHMRRCRAEAVERHAALRVRRQQPRQIRDLPRRPVDRDGVVRAAAKLAHRARQLIRRLRAIVELREHHRRVVRILQLHIVQDAVRAREQLHHRLRRRVGPQRLKLLDRRLDALLLLLRASALLAFKKEILDRHIILSSLRISIIAESDARIVSKNM